MRRSKSGGPVDTSYWQWPTSMTRPSFNCFCTLSSLCSPSSYLHSGRWGGQENCAQKQTMAHFGVVVSLPPLCLLFLNVCTCAFVLFVRFHSLSVNREKKLKTKNKNNLWNMASSMESALDQQRLTQFGWAQWVDRDTRSSRQRLAQSLADKDE